MMQFFLPDDGATDRLGRALATILTPGLTIHLDGHLGAGKTALTRAMLRGLGHAGPVKSPTYALLESYRLEVQGEQWQILHFDLYRLGDAREFLEAGFREEFDGRNICMIEWPQRAATALPPPDILIRLAQKDAGREVEFHALSDKARLRLAQLHFDPTL